MDISTDTYNTYYVNNNSADMNTKVYENFTVVMSKTEFVTTYEDLLKEETFYEETEKEENSENEDVKKVSEEQVTLTSADVKKEITEEAPMENKRVIVMVNRKPVVLHGKPRYVFVDIFDYIDFDLSTPQGAIVTTLNGVQAQFMEELHDGDVIEVYWKTS